MKIARLLIIATLTGGIWSGTAQAQTPQQLPAEFPPASYKGKQYVDSKGCVFIRAGIDGDVSWIPRVTRSRKVVCGFQPTLGTAVASAPAAAPKPAAPEITVAPVTPTAPKPAARKVVRKPAPKVVRQTAPKPAPRKVVTVAAPVAPAPQPAPRVQATARGASACPDASPMAQRYLRTSGGLAVRCGPQAAPIAGTARTVTVTQGGATVTLAPARTTPVVTAPRAAARLAYRTPAANPARVTTTTRIVPRHVAHNRVNTRNVTVPPGYKEVWEDGRLNPRRAEGDIVGRANMLLVWTQTVPRRLIDRRSGKDVTASVPLIYPYTDVAVQRRELGDVTIVMRNGQTMKRVKRNRGARTQVTVQRAPTYSSRSTPRVETGKPAAAARSASGRYVQVGTYRDPANAQRTAQRLKRMGLPARIDQFSRGGKTYMIVRSGPFKAGSTGAAVQKIRRAGYRDAFARN